MNERVLGKRGVLSLLITFFLSGVCLIGAEPIPFIFDSDMGNDIDDALALGVIHSLASRAECDLLGVTLTKEHELAPSFVAAINTFYGRGDVPIGMVRNGKGREGSTYLSSLEEKASGDYVYPRDIETDSGAEESVALLRRLLAAAEDNSVVIAQVGFSTNLARLLESPPDDVSPLDGIDLVRKKVRLLSAMAGNFAKLSPEFNVREDVPSAQKLAADWPTEIIFSGYEIGIAVPYPAESIEKDFGYVENHPIVDSYRAYSEMPYDRPTWDLTSVLYAMRPDRGYFDLSKPGQVTVDAEGRTSFEESPEGNHRYLIMSEAQEVKTLEALIQLTSQPPCRQTTN